MSSNKILKDGAQPLGAYPHVKRVGDFLFVSGTSSRRPDNTHIGADQNEDGSWTLDIKAQTKAVLDNINTILESVDSSIDDVVDISTFLVDMKDFKGYNEVYGTFFSPESAPTRTTVAVHQLPHPNLLIEIKAVAYKPINKA